MPAVIIVPEPNNAASTVPRVVMQRDIRPGHCGQEAAHGEGGRLDVAALWWMPRSLPPLQPQRFSVAAIEDTKVGDNHCEAVAL